MSRLFLFLIISVIPRSSFQDNPHHSFRVVQEDDLTIAITSAGPKYREPLFEYYEVVQLNQDPAQEESILFRPHKFTRGSDGNFYVIDSGNHRVAVFNEHGEYVRSFGSEGAGPGAYRRMRFQGLYGNILHILDSDLRRTTLVHLDGTVIDVLTMPRPKTWDVPSRFQLSEDKQLLLSNLNELGMEYTTQMASVTIVNSEYDTLLHTRTDAVEISIVADIPGEPGTRNGVMVHFPGYPCAAYSPEVGILLTDGRHPVIDQYDTLGKQIRRIELDMPPEQVPNRERRWLNDEANRKIVESSGLQRDAARMRRNLLTIADPKGYWAEMAIDDAGFIWLSVVENWYHYDDNPDTDVCDIFSPVGEYLGRTELPDSFDDCVAVGGYLCVIHEDLETGDYYPTVYEIHPAIPGLEYPN